MTVAAKTSVSPFLCPKCQLTVPDFELRPGLTTKFCSGCKGTWFGEGALAAYLGTEEDFASSPSPKPRPDNESAKRACPHCGKSDLQQIPYEEGNDAPLLESCPKCRGIWLDGGKLQTLSGWVRRQKAEAQSRNHSDLKSVMRTWSKHSRTSYAGHQEAAPPDAALNQEIAEVLARPRYGNLRSIESSDLPGPSTLELDETWVNALALPAAFFLAWWVVHVAHLLNFFLWPLTIPVHEVGHALILWSGGFRATPLPFGLTFSSEHRSAFAGVCYLFLLGLLARKARKEHHYFLFALAVVLLGLQGYFTLVLDEKDVREVSAFGGIGGQFYLSTVLITAFYHPMPARLRWDFWRFAILIWGAYNFLHIWSVWQSIANHQQDIPWGSLLFGEGDANGDMDRLVNEFGWSRGSIIQTYVELGWLCSVVLVGHYLTFLGLALRRRLRPPPTRR